VSQTRRQVQEAQKLLGLGTAAGVPVRGGPRGKAAKTGRTAVPQWRRLLGIDGLAGMNTERNNPNAKPKQFFQAKKAEGVKKRAVGGVLAEGKACQQKSRPLAPQKSGLISSGQFGTGVQDGVALRVHLDCAGLRI